MTRSEDEYAVLRAARNWCDQYSYLPSFRDIAAATGLSVGNVHAIVRRLAESGDISYVPKLARSIRPR